MIAALDARLASSSAPTAYQHRTSGGAYCVELEADRPFINVAGVCDRHKRVAFKMLEEQRRANVRSCIVQQDSASSVVP
jgi:hypothetical protein